MRKPQKLVRVENTKERPYFRALREYQDFLRQTKCPDASLSDTIGYLLGFSAMRRVDGR